jgi:glycosyltransferase involved in cell wall biosynthesis
MKKFDVGYLSFDSLQEGVGTSQILRLLEEHQKNGLTVSLVTFEKKEPPKWLTERVDNSKIRWEKVDFGQYGKLPAILRLLKMSQVIPNATVLHGRSDLATAGANLFGKSPVLWDIRSLWKEQKRIMNPQQIGKATNFGLGLVETLNAKQSAAYATLSHAVLPVLREKFPNLPDHSAVIPTCVDLDLFGFSRNFSNRKVVLISGSFNALYDFDMTKKVLAALKEEFEMSVVWIKGIKTDAQNFGLGEKIIEGVPHHEMPKWVAASTVGVALCKTGDVSLSGAMPTKIAEFLACGRPVIVSKGIGDLDIMLKENRVGITIDQNDNLALKMEELAELLSDPEISTRCRNLAEEKFNISTAAKKYSDLYQMMS